MPKKWLNLIYDKGEYGEFNMKDFSKSNKFTENTRQKIPWTKAPMLF